METEQQLQNKIIKYLEGIGCYVIKTIATNKRGCPDLLFCLNGTFNAIEVKRAGKLSTLTEIQKFNIDLINKTGGTAVAVDTLQEVKKLFK